MLSGRLLSALEQLLSHNTLRNPQGARHVCMIRDTVRGNFSKSNSKYFNALILGNVRY